MPTQGEKNYDWLKLARRLQSIAQAGLTFTEGPYDKERYRELMEISATLVTEFTGKTFETVHDLFSFETGYLTPKVDVRGVVFDANKILLVKETADNRWALPGGWADVDLSPKENAVKEIEEESGLKTEPIRLLAIMDKKFHQHPPDIYHCYKLFILCKKIGGSLKGSIETSEVGFFELQQLPELSHERNTEAQIKLMFDYLQNPEKDVWVD